MGHRARKETQEKMEKWAWMGQRARQDIQEKMELTVHPELVSTAKIKKTTQSTGYHRRFQVNL